MDSDNDGLISPQNTDIEVISDDLLVIIAPLLYELEELNTTLSLNEFCDAMDKL